MNRTIPIRATAAVVVAAALTSAVAGTANWRLALLAVLAGVAVAATRIRYARLASLALLAAVLALATAGASAGSDDRAMSYASPGSACASVSASREPQLAYVRARGASCGTARRVVGDWLDRRPGERQRPVHGYRCRESREPAGVACRRAERTVSASYR